MDGFDLESEAERNAEGLTFGPKPRRLQILEEEAARGLPPPEVYQSKGKVKPSADLSIAAILANPERLVAVWVVEGGKEATLARLARLGEPKQYEHWWGEVYNRLLVSSQVGILLDAIKYVDDSRNERIAYMKGIGPVAHPGRFIASRLKADGVKLPHAPGAPR